MSAEQDREFFDTFMMILGALVVSTVAIYVLSNRVAAQTQVAWTAIEPAKRNLVAERLNPVGEVAMMGEVPETPVATQAAVVELNGEQVYNQACVICHGAGVAGAPMFGDTALWEPRLAQGMDMLNEHAIKGFNAMPAKGGYINLSDQNVIDAVQFMVDAL